MTNDNQGGGAANPNLDAALPKQTVAETRWPWPSQTYDAQLAPTTHQHLSLDTQARSLQANAPTEVSVPITNTTRHNSRQQDEGRDLFFAIGPSFNQYELIRPLGSGGMGQVFLARDTRLARLVALKFLTKAGAQRSQRFAAEARATAQLNHPNVVVIYDIGAHAGYLFMALEYIKGLTLHQWVQVRREQARQFANIGDQLAATGHADAQTLDRVAVTPERAVELMIPVVQALVSAHERGIIHRDLKLSNVMLTESGTVKVLDFGIAKLLDAVTSDAPGAPVNPSEVSLTRTGSMIGTAAYMSPEQWGIDSVDQRADIWAVGMMLYELTMGIHPLTPLNRGRLLTIPDLAITMPSVRAMRPELGKLASIIDRCLLKRKADRIASAAALLAELQDLTRPYRRAADYDRNPFIGLAAFQEADADNFFGRDEAVGQVVARLAEVPLLAVVGASGAGKSSFIRAGVIPALKRGGDAWEAFVLRPGPRPMDCVVDLLLQHAWQSSTGSTDTISSADGNEARDEQARDALVERLRIEPGYVGKMLRSRARRKLERIVIFIDQFEELVTLAPKEEREHFLACLAGVADDAGSPLRVLISVRSDYIDRIATTQTALSEFSRGLTLLAPMDRNGLRAALIQPLEALDYRFESDALVTEMLDVLEHTVGALPLLQFTAAKLWERRDDARRMLTIQSYRELGGVAGTLASHADAVLGAMSSSDQKLARTVFVRLVTPERTRALSTMSELCELAGAAKASMEHVVGRLIDARLLVAESGSKGNGTVELVHESLITQWPTLTRWLNESKEDAAFVAGLRSAAKQWESSKRADGRLWRGQVAQEAQIWYERYQRDGRSDLSSSEEQYLRAVVSLIQRNRTRRRQFLVGVVAVLGAFALVVSYMAIQTAQEAARAEQGAMRARNATRMATVREYRHDPTTVLALLREVESGELPRGWPALAMRVVNAPVARTVLTHPEEVTFASFSPDGSHIATACTDHTARVWRTDGHGEPLVLRGHEDKVYSAVFSPDGTLIATASQDTTVRVWRADGQGDPLVLRGHKAIVLTTAFSPDGKHIVTASFDGTVRVWRTDGHGEPLVLRGHGAPVMRAAFSPDGKRIVSGAFDRTVRVWNADGHGEPIVLRGHEDRVLTVGFSPDSKHVISGSMDKTARVWPADGKGEPLILRGHDNMVYSVAFSPDGTRIATASMDQTARVWRADGRGEPMVLRGHEDRIYAAMFSPDGAYLVTASSDKTARVWRVDGQGEPPVLRGHENLVYGVTFDPSGNRIATASADKTVRVWPADGQGEPTVLQGHTDLVRSVRFNADGTRIVTAAFDRTARVWRADGRGKPLVLRGHDDKVAAAAFSPDGRRIVTASWDKTARVWSADGRGKPLVLRGHQEDVTAAEFSPDGRHIVTASYDKTARVWNADGHGEPLVLHGHQDRIESAAFSPDGRRIVTASWDKTARVWDLDGQSEPLVLRGHSDRVYSAAFSPDGKRVVTASWDKTARVWDLDGHSEPLVFSGHDGRVTAAEFSPDGLRIVTASLDKTARVWSDLRPVTIDDPRLWTRTNYCMPAARRQQLLGVSSETAIANEQRCLRRVRDMAR